ncbi:MAG: 2-oxoacid:acceptor oxidoreductase family protein [Chloroflexota bacterium]
MERARGRGVEVEDQPSAIDRPKIGRKEIQLAGIGGQGLALAGVILAEAAGMYEGRHVTHTEVHGANARGGPSRSEVIVSDDEIDFTFLTAPDVLLATTPGDVKRYLPSLKPGGILIVDSTAITDIPETNAKVYRLPLTSIARTELGNEVVLGIVALAAIAVLSGVVSMEALEKAVAKNVPAKALELNRRALEAGVNAARRAI